MVFRIHRRLQWDIYCWRLTQPLCKPELLYQPRIEDPWQRIQLKVRNINGHLPGCFAYPDELRDLFLSNSSLPHYYIWNPADLCFAPIKSESTWGQITQSSPLFMIKTK